MAGIIKVNQYQDFNGNTLFTSDGNGNLTTQKTLYPAFAVTKSGNQDLTDQTTTKVTWETEIFDTDNAFGDNKFTVPTGKDGKYQFNSALMIDALANSQLEYGFIYIYKNGSLEFETVSDFRDSDTRRFHMTLGLLLDLSAGDYIEVYTNISDNSGNPRINASDSEAHFSGYRIGS